MTRPMSTQYPIAFRADMKSYPLHSLMNAPSIFYFRYTFTARWRVAETWAADMWRSTSRSAVDRCEESPSELSPGFARHNVKMTTVRTERNCLWTLKCVTRWSKEEDWRFFTFNGNWNIGWYCRMWFLQLTFCWLVLNGSVFLLSRLFTKLAATILKVCKLVSSSLSIRLRKSYSKFSRRSILMIWIPTAIYRSVSAKFFYRFKAVIWLSQRLLFKRLEFPASLRSLFWQTKGFFLV